MWGNELQAEILEEFAERQGMAMTETLVDSGTWNPGEWHNDYGKVARLEALRRDYRRRPQVYRKGDAAAAKKRAAKYKQSLIDDPEKRSRYLEKARLRNKRTREKYAEKISLRRAAEYVKKKAARALG
jgi:hypothetical protein